MIQERLKITNYIKHIRSSVINSEELNSNLDEFVLDINGMTNYRVKHFLNNLASFEGCRLLEIGSYQGATFCSMLFNNKQIDSAETITNWSEFGKNGEKDKKKLEHRLKSEFNRNNKEHHNISNKL